MEDNVEIRQDGQTQINDKKEMEENVEKIFIHIPGVNLTFPRLSDSIDGNFDSKMQTFDSRRTLIREKTDRKFDFVCEMLQIQMSDLHRTTLGLMNDQNGAIFGSTISGNTESTTATYLNYMNPVCAKCKTLMTSWIQAKIGLMSNGVCRWKLSENLYNYELRTKRFVSLANDVLENIKKIFEIGLRLLSELSNENIDYRFFQDLFIALDDYNVVAYMLQFYKSENSKTRKFHQKITFENVLNKMARFSGSTLASNLAKKISKYCNNFAELNSIISSESAALKLMTSEFKRAESSDSKNANETSDYFSTSTNSSSSHRNYLPQIAGNENPRALPKIPPFASNPKFSKKLQHFYAHFIQSRYAIFEIIVHCQSTRMQQNLSSSSEQRATLIDKNSFWRKYVFEMWFHFSKDFYANSLFGFQRLPSSLVINQEWAWKIRAFFIGLLTAAPLPRDVCSIQPFISKINKGLAFGQWLETIAYCQSNNNDKHVVALVNSNKISELISFGSFSGDETNLATRQFVHNFSHSKIVAYLASYNLKKISYIYRMYKSFDSEETKLDTWLKTRLSTKVYFVTKSSLQDSFPNKKVWQKVKANEQKVAQEYVTYLVTTVLEPLSLPSEEFAQETAQHLFEILLEQFFSSWLDFVRNSGIKFKPAAGNQLKVDFESAKMWLKNNSSLHSEKENRIWKINVFAKIDAALHVLSNKVVKENNTQMVAFSKNSKISPGSLDKDVLHSDNTDDNVVIVLPDFQQWKRLRSRGLFNCFYCV